ncbi:MAG: PEP-CTERM sorting domain-containing protein, partial [Chloroflexota bacterium]|nr:PEP-CTERM sorting domain-containing protein [Chloroflexota bacterium]
GWQNGGQAPSPQIISTGGPAGAGDRYMLATSDGSGAGGRLTVFNFQQWVGNNFVTAGVTAISIDLRNEGSVALSIRLAFQADTFNGAPGYLTAPMLLPVGSGWQHFTISVTSASLIAVGGPTPFNTFFDNGSGWMRIINEAGTSNLNGDPIVGRLGIDNIRAVPEPTSIALFAGGTLLLAAAARRRIRF